MKRQSVDHLRRSASIRRWVLAAALACALASGAVVTAQSRTGSLEGSIVDSGGAAIAGAPVAARNLDTDQTRSTRSDARGAYRLLDMPVGTYELRVEYGGFAPYVHGGVAVAIGQTARIDITLQPATIVENVAVTAQPPPLDPGQTAVATSIDTERIEELPVRSRNYLEFVLLAPGVAPGPDAATTSGAASSFLADSGFSFGGLRPRSNTLTIDGLDNNDDFSGSSRTELSLETVREFQVLNNGWLAENGGASGGAINVVTRSGANVVHGDAFLFAQSGAFNAAPKLGETGGKRPRLNRYRGGMAMGGPIFKSRTFYYAAAEREHADGSSASDVDPNAATLINAALAAGVPGPGEIPHLTIGLSPTARRETEWSAKITHEFAGHGELGARIAGNDNRDEGDGNSGALADASARVRRTTDDAGVASWWTTTLGARTTNDLRAQFAKRGVRLVPAHEETGVIITGVAEFGTPYAGHNTHDQTYLDLADTIGLSRGPHFLKFGGSIRRLRVTGSTADGVAGVRIYRTLDDFLAGRPQETRIMSSSESLDLRTTRTSVFLQDHWTPRSTVTIDFGARFDATFLPRSLDITNRQLSPRVGFAYQPQGGWLIRGGAGVFADRIVLAALERPWLFRQRGVTERVFVDGLASASPSGYTARRGTWDPRSTQASTGVERQLTGNLTMSVNYLLVLGRKLPRTVDVNLAPPTVLTPLNAASLGVDAPVPQQSGRPVFGPARLNPAFDAVFEVQPTAASTYHGVTGALNRRLANELEWSVAYTWSRATDSASDFDEQPQDPYALADERGPSRYDQRHRLVANALFELPIGEEEDRRPGVAPGRLVRAFSHIEIAPIVMIASGLPANAVTGADDNQSRAFPFTSRPLGVARNTRRLPASVTLDLRILKYFPIRPHGKLDVVVEAFNVMNRTNVTQINTVYGPFQTPLPSFGRPITAGPARQFQVSADFEF